MHLLLVGVNLGGISRSNIGVIWNCRSMTLLAIHVKLIFLCIYHFMSRNFCTMSQRKKMVLWVTFKLALRMRRVVITQHLQQEPCSHCLTVCPLHMVGLTTVLENKAGPLVRDRQLLVRTSKFLNISLQIDVWISQNSDQDRQLFQLSLEHGKRHLIGHTFKFHITSRLFKMFHNIVNVKKESKILTDVWC